MEAYQTEFIQFALDNGVLRFGEFTLKSGRRSPYFFNSGLFNNGESLAQLGYFYACAIEDSGLEFDMLFGPAYKGIPLASAVAVALASHFDRSVPFCFNRKETKDHGEGGITFGAELEGRVLIVDDVISAGTSINLSVDIIKAAGAKAVAAAVAMDRQERGTGPLSAVQEVEQRHNIKVISIISLADMLEYLELTQDAGKNLAKIRQYREQYGIS